MVGYISTQCSVWADQNLAIWTAWEMEKAPAYCTDQILFHYFAAGINIALDVMIALIPITQQWKLTLDLKKEVFVVVDLRCRV
jgi:hypothetical protein